ncbi:MAG: hypothetical protein ACO24H_02360 [Polynucleobacter sp.]
MLQKTTGGVAKNDTSKRLKTKKSAHFATGKARILQHPLSQFATPAPEFFR